MFYMHRASEESSYGFSYNSLLERKYNWIMYDIWTANGSYNNALM